MGHFLLACTTTLVYSAACQVPWLRVVSDHGNSGSGRDIVHLRVVKRCQSRLRLSSYRVMPQVLFSDLAKRLDYGFCALLSTSTSKPTPHGKHGRLHATSSLLIPLLQSDTLFSVRIELH